MVSIIISFFFERLFSVVHIYQRGIEMFEQNLPVIVAQPDERHANRTGPVLKWYDRLIRNR